MKKILLYVAAGVVGLLLVVGMSVGAAVLIFSKMSAPDKEEEKKPEITLAAENIFVLKPFVTNLADKNPPRYISITFELVTGAAADTEKLKGNLPLVRDAIVAVLNAKKSADVTGQTGATVLKTEIQEKLDEVLGKPLVQKVLITDLVVQF